jgi:hypothetical protein
MVSADYVDLLAGLDIILNVVTAQTKPGLCELKWFGFGGDVLLSDRFGQKAFNGMS